MEDFEVGSVLLNLENNRPVILRDDIYGKKPDELVTVEPEKEYGFSIKNVPREMLAGIPISSHLAKNLTNKCQLDGLIRIEKIPLDDESFMISGYGRIGGFKWPVPKIVRFVHEVQHFLRSDRDDFSDCVQRLGYFNRPTIVNKTNIKV